ncbi:CidA/LrgA family protein [Aestuariibacter halophilus]|uniref:CidA/LrgA family protein n=1 Tax=Fluctibacter halophilus TaxID=226011 RepID=A0ABS8G836_9ALTE|nr:CidA/LrgA family protein [Aestuariibacter halophilus]MCC2616624.1 CidA/LrgA family protein [Aestuariibacter halophilus]
MLHWCKSLLAIAFICLLYTLSVWCVQRWQLPLPAPLLGMFILLGLLVLFPSVAAQVQLGGQWLLRHMSVMFVPATLGVITLYEGLQAHVWAIALVLVASTIASLWITSLIAQRVLPDEDEG